MARFKAHILGVMWVITNVFRKDVNRPVFAPTKTYAAWEAPAPCRWHQHSWVELQPTALTEGPLCPVRNRQCSSKRGPPVVRSPGKYVRPWTDLECARTIRRRHGGSGRGPEADDLRLASPAMEMTVSTDRHEPAWSPSFSNRAAILACSRRSEVFGLTLPRVDLLRRQLLVEQQLITVQGRAPFLAPPKTAASVRQVPLPGIVVDAVAAHLAKFEPGELGTVFSGEKGGAASAQRLLRARVASRRGSGPSETGDQVPRAPSLLRQPPDPTR